MSAVDRVGFVEIVRFLCNFLTEIIDTNKLFLEPCDGRPRTSTKGVQITKA